MCPLTPKSLAFAVWVSKLHHTGAEKERNRGREGGKERERDRENNRESGKGKKALGPIMAQKKQRAIFQ